MVASGTMQTQMAAIRFENGFWNCLMLTAACPHCAPIGQGLWELRSSLDSNRIARAIFCRGEGHMILLHDIDLALKRKRGVT